MGYRDPFVLDKSEYKRDLNVRKHYVSDAACYLSIMTGRPREEAEQFVVNSLRPGGEFEFKDPVVYYLERGENGDREKKVGTMSQYLGESTRGQHLIAPTFTTYLPPHVKKSLLVDYIDANVKARGVAKKAMFAAMKAGDKLMEATKKIEQNYKKINNNSISGAHVSPSTPLYNPTAHSTLTSCCRVTSGYGNANNEKFLCGNRHYWSPEITKNNIISIVNHSDYAAMEAAMLKYNLRHPTLNETIDCVRYSTDLYWPGEQKAFDKIVLLLSKLTPIQRSAFVYTGDLYHLMKMNPEFVHGFLTKMATLNEVPHPNPSSVLANVPDDIKHLACQIYRDEMMGKDLSKMEGTPEEAVVATVCANLMAHLNEHRDFIRAFWVTENVPASVAYLPQSIRRSAITSDTDSTIFTVQDWVKWHRGSIKFDTFSRSIAASVVFLAAATITHVLARMSANFGIEEKRLHQIAMKNEYAFDVFTATQVAKHYYAYIGCQEGTLFKKHKQEIKGVHLKSSKAPKRIMKDAENLMIDIMETVMDERQIDLKAILKMIGDTEREVMQSIKDGKSEFLSFAQVQTAESYTKGPMQSNYIHYLMWSEVFAPKYGMSGNPPYTCIKVSTELKSPAALREWIASFEDRELASRMTAFIARSGRKNITTFWIPADIVATSGIPPEIYQAINIRKIVFETTKVYYILLETLGCFFVNKKMTKLVSDFH